MSLFAQRLIDWQHQHGRHGLPWQQTQDPYRVWLAEIMLQQTQVATVAPYYERFLACFSTLDSLAAAKVEQVMSLWSGLGYYARARNLHKCAQVIIAEHDGQFPRHPETIASLPGIGRSTANAIAVFCFAAREPILDGNVKRLLCRLLGIAGYPGTTAVESRLWRDASALLPATRVATYIQAQMDMGAAICTRGNPRCGECPVADLCIAHKENRVAELPTPRPRKILPERQVRLLVLHAGRRVLLELRPPTGIWGGLLSLPELPDDRDVAEYCQRRFGTDVGAVLPAPTFSHGFTHFRLHIQPLVCAATLPSRIEEGGLRWIDQAELAQAALPAPVRKLLYQVFSAFP